MLSIIRTSLSFHYPFGQGREDQSEAGAACLTLINELSAASKAVRTAILSSIKFTVKLKRKKGDIILECSGDSDYPK